MIKIQNKVLIKIRLSILTKVRISMLTKVRNAMEKFSSVIALLLFITSIAQGQNNILVVLAHPNLEVSEVNKSFVSKISASDLVTINDLYKKYDDFNINIDEEQQLLIVHDIIIFQFPLYWFSSPALLKKWQDDVITSEFSIGENNQLKGKKLMIVVSAGGSEKDYHHGGTMNITMDEVLAPFESFALLTEMEYLSPFVTYSVPNPTLLYIPMSQEDRKTRDLFIDSQANKLMERIEALK